MSAEAATAPNQPDRRPRGRRWFVAALVPCLAIGGCVTETPTRSRGPRVLPAPVAPQAGAAPATLPAGPIARPAPAGSSFSTSISISLVPLGLVPYDGLVVPLVSPDGRFIASETGDAPSWPTLLAAADASPALGTRLSVFDLTGAALREVAVPEPGPVGAILGRSCDSRGYLIEWPRPDGTRWIGRRAWLTGAVDWLVRTDAVNAHAVADGQTLVFTTRPVSAAENSLIVRYQGGTERVLVTPGVSYQFPTFSPDARVAVVIARTQQGLELLAVRIRHSDGAVPTALTVVARRLLDASTDTALAYQAVAPVQVLAASGGDAADPDAPAVLFFPALRRMVLFDWTNSAILPLGENSVGAVRSPLPQSPGYFQTVPKGVVFTPPPVAAQQPGKQAPEARVTDVPYLVRATSNAERPFVLFGPADGKRFQVLLMAPAPPGATNVLPAQ